MANTYKNIVITPNIGSSVEDPKIIFSGGDATTNTDIILKVYPTSSGTLSLEGSAGQLFSVTNDLTNTIFSVNDVSGIPSIEVNANGQVDIARFNGNVFIGTGSANTTVLSNLVVGTTTVINTAGYWVGPSISAATGTVTSVAMTVPTGLTVSGTPITTSGTLAISLQSGYSIPTTTSQTNWDSAFSQRLQWDGGSTNLVASTGRSSLGLGSLATQSSVSLSSQVSGTLAVGSGGTGVTTSTGSTSVVLSSGPTITNLKEKSSAIAASNIDLSLGNYFTKTITATTTFTVSNVASSGDVSAFILVLTNGASSQITWFSGVTWAGGSAPALTVSGTDILGFFTINGGTTWRGLLLAKAIA